MARILVTGSTTGLGLAAAQQLSDDGHEVVVHARSESRLSKAPELASMFGAVVGDLGVLEQVHEVAEQTNQLGPFDAVIHNAGVVDGESVFDVNVVAPFVLTAQIVRPQRLVYLSSDMHRGGSTDLSRIDRGRVSYSDSKLWVTALAMTVAVRWPEVASHAVDPGWVPTRMGGAGAPDDLEAGHQTQTWLATSSDVTPATGGYWYHRRTQPPHPASADPVFQQRLIDVLEQLTGHQLPR